MNVNQTTTLLKAYLSRLHFWRAQYEQARKDGDAHLADTPAQRISFYEHQIEQLLATAYPIRFYSPRPLRDHT